MNSLYTDTLSAARAEAPLVRPTPPKAPNLPTSYMAQLHPATHWEQGRYIAETVKYAAELANYTVRKDLPESIQKATKAGFEESYRQLPNADLKKIEEMVRTVTQPIGHNVRDGLVEGTYTVKHNIYSEAKYHLLVGTISLAASFFLFKYWQKKFSDHSLGFIELKDKRPTQNWNFWIKRAFRAPQPLTLDGLYLNNKNRKQAEQFYAALENSTREKLRLPSLVIKGPSHVGKILIAKYIAQNYNYRIFSSKAILHTMQLEGMHAAEKIYEWAKDFSWVFGKKIIILEDAQVLFDQHEVFEVLKANPDFTIIACVNTDKPNSDYKKLHFDFELHIEKPNAKERYELFHFFLKKYSDNPELYSYNALEELSKESDGFTPWEIQQICQRAFFRSSAKDGEMTIDLLKMSLKEAKKPFFNH